MNPKWVENYEKIMKANENSTRVIHLTDEDKINFILRCEKVYKTSTEDIIKRLEQNGHEGSPEIRRWFRYAKELNYE